ASPADIDTIEQLLQVLDQNDSPEEVALVAKPRLIYVEHTSASEVASVVKQVYSDRLQTASGGGGGQPNPAELFLALRGGGGGRNNRGGNRQQDEVSKMTVGVDERNNALVVAAPDPLFLQVKDLVKELDQPFTEPHETTKLVALKNPEVMKSALLSVLGEQ